ncbi:hemerythrin domain-containing protein [Sphingomonas sp. M1A8_2b]
MNDKVASDRVMVPAASDEDRANWAQLIDDHRRIAEQCIDLADLAQGSREQSDVASRKLIELALTVAKHLDLEDEVIDRTVMAMETKYSPDTIATMEENLDILRSDWKAFIGRWLPVIMPGDWEKFGVQAESMLDRLSSQVMLETEILYDHALQDGVVRPGGAVLH